MVLKTEPISSHFPTQNATHHPVYVLYWFVCSFLAVRLNFWSWLLIVQYILPSAHCCAHLKLCINNENVQGLLAQVGRELHFLRLCFRALLCFRELCFVFESVVQVFYIKLHVSFSSEAHLSCTLRKVHTDLCCTGVCRMQKRLRQLPFHSHLFLKCRNKITENPA